ncbi:unnamed protein product [Rotaria sp. Silwood1]|nr:unnamed protein product [Rotaria sp. Silwood1]CAF1637734.1 unnamed protein product [Rotaria sp. Silwood1]CAF3808141.1 unnamed protein product [Rotaria sp. Silwood1]CAF5122631.1 unnamed protein product [Rotaria sp. Silwood1]
MDHMKRKLSFNQLSEENTKKLRNELLDELIISSIESLSNELFYEMFDYLDGIEIYQAFSNLNTRFQQLLTSSSILFKIDLNHITSKEIFMINYKQIKHQIYSIYFQYPVNINQLLISFTIDSSFNRLESLVIEDIQPDKLISFLINLNSLPQLFSLNIRTIHTIEDLNNIYRLIFALPKLKYNKLYLYGNECSISIPMAIEKQFSTIEYLHIAHWYTFDELSALISYTPQLRHLNLSHANQNHSTIETMLPITFDNLTYIKMYTNYINFDEFEIFIKNIYSKLKVLYVTFLYQDITFLYAYRWEQLILRYLSQLEKFSLKYYEYKYSIYSGERNQFISSFWIERKLIFNVEINENNILYLVCPYKKKWYEYNNSTVEYLTSTQLTIKYVFYYEAANDLFIYIKRILNIVQIYHLDIEQKISIGRLMQIIHLLPDLITLKMNSLTCHRSRINKEFPTCSLEHASKIKKVYLETTQAIQEIYFLLNICPHMEFLNIDSIKSMTIELFVRNILNKINKDHHKDLRLLCIYVSKADDNMIKSLNKMIDNEKILSNYTIHHELDNIYLQWK